MQQARATYVDSEPDSASDSMSGGSSDTEKDHMSEKEQKSDEEQDASSALSLQTMQLQWESYVKKLKESGTLSNALAVCDVSGSMTGQPMEVSDCTLSSVSLHAYFASSSSLSTV